MIVPSKSKAAIFGRSFGAKFVPYKQVDDKIGCFFHMNGVVPCTSDVELLLKMGNTLFRSSVKLVKILERGSI